jgi:D-alanyl-D-alanine carboxypeptidase
VETSYGKGGLELVTPRSLPQAVLVNRPLVERVIAPKGVELPVDKGQEVGEVRVYDRGRLLARSPLVASRSIGDPGAFARTGWYIGRTAHNMWGWVS